MICKYMTLVGTGDRCRRKQPSLKSPRSGGCGGVLPGGNALMQVAYSAKLEGNSLNEVNGFLLSIKFFSDLLTAYRGN